MDTDQKQTEFDLTGSVHARNPGYRSIYFAFSPYIVMAKSKKPRGQDRSSPLGRVIPYISGSRLKQVSRGQSELSAGAVLPPGSPFRQRSLSGSRSYGVSQGSGTDNAAERKRRPVHWKNSLCPSSILYLSIRRNIQNQIFFIGRFCPIHSFFEICPVFAAVFPIIGRISGKLAKYFS